MTKTMSAVALLAVLATTLAFTNQGASQPVKSAPEYFVTSDGDAAHLWVREGTTLRVVGHGECKECAAHKGHEGHEHKEGEAHDHDDN